MTSDAHTILVVDDDLDVRDALCELLEDSAFHVILARDGVDALAVLRAVEIDLVVLDLGMPQMDGWQFLEHRAREPRFAAIPVVVVSARDESSALIGDPRVDALIRKPFAVTVLLNAIGRCLVTTGARMGRPPLIRMPRSALLARIDFLRASGLVAETAFPLRDVSLAELTDDGLRMIVAEMERHTH